MLDIEQVIYFTCNGNITTERVGYYAGSKELKDFKVFISGKDVTKCLPTEIIDDLKKQYVELRAQEDLENSYIK